MVAVSSVAKVSPVSPSPALARVPWGMSTGQPSVSAVLNRSTVRDGLAGSRAVSTSAPMRS